MFDTYLGQFQTVRRSQGDYLDLSALDRSVDAEIRRPSPVKVTPNTSTTSLKTAGLERWRAQMKQKKEELLAKMTGTTKRVTLRDPLESVLTKKVPSSLPSSKKIKKKSRPTIYEVQIAGIEYPVADPHGKRRFKIHFSYYLKDDPNRKVRGKTVRFGIKDKPYYIDHKDKRQRDVALSRSRSHHSPFKHQFWSYYLLNMAPTMKLGFQGFLDHFRVYG